jgi:hypothetical protein
LRDHHGHVSRTRGKTGRVSGLPRMVTAVD